MQKFFLIGLSLLLFSPSLSLAQSFSGMGVVSGGSSSSAQAISGDGQTVAGRVDVVDGAQIAQWDSLGGLQPLGYANGATNNNTVGDVSHDGFYITGTVEGTSFQQTAFRWSESGGYQLLGNLSGGSSSFGARMNGDGSIIVGTGDSASGEQAFRWTESDGMVGLGDFAGGDFRSQARGISSDGSVIVGTGTISDGTRAARWTDANGMENLGVMAGGTISFATSVSSDGSTIVGVSDSATSVGEAAIWNAANEIVGLGNLGGASDFSIAWDVSGDGEFAVGYSTRSGRDVAFLWDEQNGMQDLKMLLESNGLDLSGWQLRSALAISDDGNTIVGLGINPSGQFEGYIAQINSIPEPSSVALILLAGLASWTPRRRT